MVCWLNGGTHADGFLHVATPGSGFSLLPLASGLLEIGMADDITDGRDSGQAIAFDSRGHDQQIEAHRLQEEQHRAAGVKVRDQIADLKGQAKGATPGQQASLQRHAEGLKQQYEQHRAAATTARDARRAVQSDLVRAKAEHTARLNALTLDPLNAAP